jgi:hypothetical protein
VELRLSKDSNHTFVAKQKGGSCTQVGEPGQSEKPADPKVSRAQLPLSSLLRAEASRKYAETFLSIYRRVAKPDRHVGDRMTIGLAVSKRQADASEWPVGHYRSNQSRSDPRNPLD